MPRRTGSTQQPVQEAIPQGKGHQKAQQKDAGFGRAFSRSLGADSSCCTLIGAGGTGAAAAKTTPSKAHAALLHTQALLNVFKYERSQPCCAAWHGVARHGCVLFMRAYHFRLSRRPQMGEIHCTCALAMRNIGVHPTGETAPKIQYLFLPKCQWGKALRRKAGHQQRLRQQYRYLSRTRTRRNDPSVGLVGSHLRSRP